MSLTNNYEKMVLDRPVLTLVMVGLLLIFFVAFIPRFELDVSADSLVLENDADLEYYRNIRARYGSDDYLILTFSPKQPLFNESSLQKIGKVRDRLQQFERVESVLTILDVPLMESPPLTLDQFSEHAPTLAEPATDRQLARAELTGSPLYRNRLISPDGETCAIQIMLERDESYLALRRERDQLREMKLSGDLDPAAVNRLQEVEGEFEQLSNRLVVQEAALIGQVRSLMDEYDRDARMHLGGVPMIVSDMMSFIRHDLVVFGFGVLTILGIMLALVFRRIRWVGLPLLTAGTTAMVTMGFLGMAGWPVTVVSSNFMALVLIFSLSLTIHLIVRYRELHALHPDLQQRELVSRTLRSKAMPCLFNAITTMVAFASLVVCDIRPVIDFGWIMVFALAASMVLAFSLFPATLMLTQPGRVQHRRDIMGLITAFLAGLAQHHGGKVLLLSGMLLTAGSYGMSQLTVENRFIDYFHSSTEIYQGMKLIDEKLGGTTPMDIIIDAPIVSADSAFEDDEWDDPFDDNGQGFATTSYWYNIQMLEQVGKIHRFLESLPETGKVLSLHTALAVLEKLEKRERVDNFFLSVLYNKLPADIKAQLINPYISEDGQQLRIAVRVYESDSGLNRKELLQKIRDHLEDERSKLGENIHLSGMVVLYNNLLQSLFRSQIQTLGFVFLAILITFALIFRSLKVALIAIVPNIIPVVLVLGSLGLLAIPLDIMTITIAAISVGIAVDDTIHYIYRYHEEWKRDGDYAASVQRAHNSIGRAMYYTSITITIGFISMVFSNFVPSIYFGLFTALAMISALLTNMLVLPVLLRTLKPWRMAID